MMMTAEKQNCRRDKHRFFIVDRPSNVIKQSSVACKPFSVYLFKTLFWKGSHRQTKLDVENPRTTKCLCSKHDGIAQYRIEADWKHCKSGGQQEDWERSHR